MRKPRSASVILILGLAAIFWAGNSCAADRRHISLAEALRIAMRQNRSLQAAGLEQQAAGSEVTVAHRRRPPACGPHHPRNDPKNRAAPALDDAV